MGSLGIYKNQGSFFFYPSNVRISSLEQIWVQKLFISVLHISNQNPGEDIGKGLIIRNN